MVFPRLPVLLAVALLATAPLAQANVSFGVSGSNVSLTVDADISFTATGTESMFLRFVFEDVFAAAPGQSHFNPLGNNIGLLRNGAAITGVQADSLWGSFNAVLGEIDGNDFTITFFGNNGITVGDTVTLTKGMALTSVPGALLPTLLPQSVMMVGNGGNRLAAPVPLSAVPEPTTALLALLGLGVVGAAAARRRA